MFSISLLLLLPLFLSVYEGTAAYEIRIHNASDFIEFSNSVNSGNHYESTTVYIDNDLDFSERTVEPVGKDDSNYFLGTFDGQGHTISNINMESSFQFVGLFGCSLGLTVRNVVVDSSCSIAYPYNSSLYSIGMGGIVGYCYLNYDCNIENSINMGSISFSGNISGYLFMGGFVGFTDYYCSNCVVNIKNCINVGVITNAGHSGMASIGGIIGTFMNPSTSYSTIGNCINFGSIAYSGTTSVSLNIGGIVGFSYSTYIKNCVSGGEMYLQDVPSSKCIGSIVGNIQSDTYIYYSFWAYIGTDVISGCGTPLDKTGTPDSPSNPDKIIIGLNSQISGGENWNRWVYNPNYASLTFMVNNVEYFAYHAITILLIDLIADNVNTNFIGWYTDPYYNNIFNLVNVTEDMTLYGMYGKEFFNVTFDANGGNVTPTTKIVAKNIIYGELPMPSKEGCIFLGWFTDANKSVTNMTIIEVSSSHTLYAHWKENKENKENSTEQIEIVFSAKDLSEDDVKKIIQKYTDATFSIVRYETNSDGVIVIVKFIGTNDAEEFVNFVRASSDSDVISMIKRIDFSHIEVGSVSFSFIYYPVLLLYLFLYVITSV